MPRGGPAGSRIQLMFGNTGQPNVDDCLVAQVEIMWEL
jgi:hypothetical protein